MAQINHRNRGYPSRISLPADRRNTAASLLPAQYFFKLELFLQTGVILRLKHSAVRKHDFEYEAPGRLQLSSPEVIMVFRYIAFVVLYTLLTLPAAATTHTVTTSGLTFTPNDLTINLGDTVVFSLGPSHDAVEVSLATWNANGSSSNGGFILPLGGGTVVLNNAQTYYYVCSVHASSGMKGKITVVIPSITTGSIAQSVFCQGGSLSVPYTVTGSYAAGNIFRAQLSDAGGGFGSPVNIGSLSGSTSGQISAAIPANALSGTGYRVRVVSTSPLVTGSDNGSNLQVLVAPAASITAGGPTTICEGDDVVLQANSGSGLSYVWRRDGNIIGGAGGSSYTATISGLYTVEVSNGVCFSTSGSVRVTVNPADPTTLTWLGSAGSDWNTVGSWDNPCAVPTAGDTVIIAGGASVPSNNPQLSLARLVVNNALGLQLANDLEITGSLVFNAGTLSLGSANLVIASTATISGAGSPSFVVTDGTGELRQAGLGGGGRSGNILFPVGYSTSVYTPVILQNSGTADEFRVRVADGVLGDGVSGAPIPASVVGKTWFISEATPGGSSANLTLQWNFTDELVSFDRAACYVARHDGSSWQPLQPAGPASGSTTIQRSVNGITSFGPFAVGDGNSPLPVDFRSLACDVHGGSVTLRWVTEHEVNSTGFEVQRTHEPPGSWLPLRFYPSAARGGEGATYTFTDTPPAAGTWFYRLRQVDTDGSTQFSPVLSAEVSAPGPALSIVSSSPSPIRLSAAGQAEVRFSAPVAGRTVLSLYNLLGERVALLFDAPVEAGVQQSVRYDPGRLVPGLYIYHLRQEERSVAMRVMMVR